MPINFPHKKFRNKQLSSWLTGLCGALLFIVVTVNVVARFGVDLAGSRPIGLDSTSGGVNGARRGLATNQSSLEHSYSVGKLFGKANGLFIVHVRVVDESNLELTIQSQVGISKVSLKWIVDSGVVLSSDTGSEGGPAVQIGPVVAGDILTQTVHYRVVEGANAGSKKIVVHVKSEDPGREFGATDVVDLDRQEPESVANKKSQSTSGGLGVSSQNVQKLSPPGAPVPGQKFFE